MNPDTPNEATPEETKNDLPLTLPLLPSSLPINVAVSVPPAEEQGENLDVDRKKDLNELTGASFLLPQEEPANVSGTGHDVAR